MKHSPARLLVVAAFLAFLPLCSAADDSSKADVESLQGTWEVTSAESNGEAPPPGLLDGASFVFKGDHLTLLGKEGTYSVDATAKPKRIEFVRGKSRQVGIYEINGDTMRFAVGPADDPATDFKTKPRTDHTSFVLKRKTTKSHPLTPCE